MLRLLFDHDFNEPTILGLLRRQPELDVLRLREVNLDRADDDVVLEWAASHGRVVVTHDVQTMVGIAFSRVSGNRAMAGLIAVRQNTPTGVQVEQLLIVSMCLEPIEIDGDVRFIPVR